MSLFSFSKSKKKSFRLLERASFFVVFYPLSLSVSGGQRTNPQIHSHGPPTAALAVETCGVEGAGWEGLTLTFPSA